MHPATAAMPLACFLSMIRPPGVEFESGYLQLLPIDKYKCPYMKNINDIGFRLYTRRNPTVYQDLVMGDDESLAHSYLDFHDHTVVYFHAFLENPNSGSAVMVREAYMLRGDTNVIMVDAQRLEAGPWYFTAADNTWYIGSFAAQFVDFLVSRGLDLSKTHFVGHSLGAQSAGVAGHALRSGRVSRITALDPAKPLFEKLPLNQKLDPSDADFVDVIHTDAGIFGVNHPLGHADFYPNGGISPQPGCELEILWPRQLLLEKCKTRTMHRFLQGYYKLDLKPYSYTYKQENRKESKEKKYFSYTKTDALLKKMNKKNKYDILKNFVNTEVGSHMTSSSGPPTLPAPSLNIDTQENGKVANIYQIQVSPEVGTKKKDLTDFESQVPTVEDMVISYQHEAPVYIEKRTKRNKRFIQLFKRNEAVEHENFLFRILDFLTKHKKNIIPVVSVMREINTLVKSANGELNHSMKERNSYIGTPPPLLAPASYSLELGKEPPGKALVKRVLGLGSQADKLVITEPGRLGK